MNSCIVADTRVLLFKHNYASLLLCVCECCVDEVMVAVLLHVLYLQLCAISSFNLNKIIIIIIIIVIDVYCFDLPLFPRREFNFTLLRILI